MGPVIGKSFEEPVDTFDLRLANADVNLDSLPDPVTAKERQYIYHERDNLETPGVKLKTSPQKKENDLLEDQNKR